MASDIARLKHNLDTESVSLNEAERRRDLAEDKARHEERERENLVLAAKGPTTYAITLENASSPGLPPPVPWTADADKASSARSSATDELPSARLSSDDVVLNEGERILADYLDLLAHQAVRNDLATQ